MMVLFDFNSVPSLEAWTVVDDAVMGGRSKGFLERSAQGNGLFKGQVSLENNGGFSLIRLDCGPVPLKGYSSVVLEVLGDGKRFQFRLKEREGDRHSYVTYFQTSGQWETIRIPLESLHPVYRGRKLSIPNFTGKTLAEIGLLIGNGRAEDFRLEIKNIRLE